VASICVHSDSAVDLVGLFTSWNVTHQRDLDDRAVRFFSDISRAQPESWQCNVRYMAGQLTEAVQNGPER
jgi:hypothetical protein